MQHNLFAPDFMRELKWFAGIIHAHLLPAVN